MTAVRLAALCVAVVMTACAPPVAQPGPELADRDEAWEAAFNAGDVTELAALYTEDARLLPPNEGMSQGTAAVEDAFRGMIDAGLRIGLESIDSRVAGDLGYSEGTYEVQDSDGEVVDTGKYIEVFRKVGGEWRISNDIWNSDLPGGPAGTQVIIAHRVKDSARWLAAWQDDDSRAEMFAEHGAPSVTIFASADHPKHHALLIDVTDMAAFRTWIDSDEAKAAKREDGVLDEGFTVFTPVE